MYKKGELVVRNPKCSLTDVSWGNPLRFLTVEGEYYFVGDKECPSCFTGRGRGIEYLFYERPIKVEKR